MTVTRTRMSLVLTGLACIACTVMYATLNSEEGSAIQAAPEMASEMALLQLAQEHTHRGVSSNVVPEAEFVEKADGHEIDTVSKASNFHDKMNWIGNDGAGFDEPSSSVKKAEKAEEHEEQEEGIANFDHPTSPPAPAAVAEEASGSASGSAEVEEEDALAGMNHVLKVTAAGSAPAETITDVIDDQADEHGAVSPPPDATQRVSDIKKVTTLLKSTVTHEQVDDEHAQDPSLPLHTPETEAKEALDHIGSASAVDQEAPEYFGSGSGSAITDKEAVEIWHDQVDPQHLTVWEMAGEMRALEQLHRRHGTKPKKEH